MKLQVLYLIRDHPNICKNIHLPAQSGNSEVLERMRRGYTREAYLQLVDHIRNILPSVSLSSDFICGFCGETEQQFQDTLSLMKQVRYNVAYLFAYSMREVSLLLLDFQTQMLIRIFDLENHRPQEVPRRCTARNKIASA